MEEDKDLKILSDNELLNNEIANRDLFLVMKDYLHSCEYFILYHRVLSNTKLSLEQLGEILGVSSDRVKQILEKVLKKVKPIMTNEQKRLAIFSKINDREGEKVELLRIEPIEPEKITRYLYIKDSLTLNEKRLLYLIYFGKYNYNKNQIASELKMSVDDCELLYDTLMKKIKVKFANKKKYESYHSNLIKNYGTKIFSISLNSELKVIDYDKLHDKYANLSYEEIMELFDRAGYVLSHDEQELLKRYYVIPERKHKFYEESLLSDINLSVFGYKKRNTMVPRHKLYEVYLNNLDDFSEEQKLFLECCFFNKRDKSEFKTTYKGSSLIRRYYYLIDRLERLYYNIFRFFDNNFGKKEYLKFKDKYGSKFSPLRTELLDLVYGINGKPLSISEMAEKYNMEYLKMHDLISDAREAAITLYSGRSQKIDIDKNIYIPYIKDYAYDFVPETREVLSFLLIDEMDYGEIAEEMGITRYRVSNIITDGIRRIDNYRYGLIEVFRISSDELEHFFEYFSDNFSEEEKDVLKYKLLYYMDNQSIASEMGLDIEDVKEYVCHFNRLYYSYSIKDVTITRKDVLDEVNRHISDSVLGRREKELASLYFGFKNEYNTEGKQYTAEEIKQKLHMSKNVYYSVHQNVIWGVKARKIGIKKPDYMFIDRKQLDIILNDSHLPISDKEREIICYLFELKGYPYKTMNELPEIFGDNKASLFRRYQRSIVSIYKYLNGEIEGNLNYEVDILPNMKYFSYSDRRIIEKYFKEGISVEKLAEEYNVGLERMLGIVRRIKTNIFDLLNNPKTKKFDYDYYMKVRYDESLPFYGELDKSILIFDLFHGMNDGLKLTIPEIAKKINLGVAYSVVNQAANNLMLSVCKHQDGIRKSQVFSYEEIKRYYELHENDMTYHHKQFYIRYFERYENQKRINGMSHGISYIILNDLLRDSRDDYITLESLNREKAIVLIKKYKTLNSSTKKELMYMFDLSERDFMNGKDVNHIYRLLNTLDNLLLLKGEGLKKGFFVK